MIDLLKWLTYLFVHSNGYYETDTISFTANKTRYHSLFVQMNPCNGRRRFFSHFLSSVTFRLQVRGVLTIIIDS